MSNLIVYHPISYEFNTPSVLLELKREQLLSKVILDCNNILKKYTNIVKIDGNILPRYLMLQFKGQLYHPDPIFPYNGNDYTQVKEDLYYLSKKKLNSTIINKIISELDLSGRFNTCIDNLREYIKTENYILAMSNPRTFGTIFISLINDIYTIKFKNPLTERDITISLHANLINKILDRCDWPPPYYNKKYFLDDETYEFSMLATDIIVILYIRMNNILASSNQQAAVLPEFYEKLKEYGYDFELFASAFNFSSTNFCSLYYDLESTVGSVGNFFNCRLVSGKYTMNPPFDESIMWNASKKVVGDLQVADSKNLPISVFITIPMWDNPEYSEYKCLREFKESGYITHIQVVDKTKVKFFDYLENKFKNLVSVFFILLQNNTAKEEHAIPISDLIEEYFP